MALFSRLSRLVRADLHALIDQLEEPEALLKQSLREMAAEIAGLEQGLAALRKREQQQQQFATNTAAALADIKGKLDLCFANQDETLARNLIRRRLELEQNKKATRLALEETGEQIEEVARALRDYQIRYEGLRQQAECLLAAESSCANKTRLHERGPQICEDDVELAFLAEKQARAAREGIGHE